jgi:hypothetical protein
MLDSVVAGFTDGKFDILDITRGEAHPARYPFDSSPNYTNIFGLTWNFKADLMCFLHSSPSPTGHITEN